MASGSVPSAAGQLDRLLERFASLAIDIGLRRREVTQFNIIQHQDPDIDDGFLLRLCEVAAGNGALCKMRRTVLRSARNR